MALFLATGAPGRGLREELVAGDILCEEVQKRVDEGYGIVEKGAPRVFTASTSFDDPSIKHMMEDCGLNMAGIVTGSPRPKRKSGTTTYTTLGEVRAEREMQIGLYHSDYTRCIITTAALNEHQNVDGYIHTYFFNCRPQGVRCRPVARWIEEHLGIPVLLLEMDYMDSRNYSAEMLKARKARKESART